jgi:glutamate racemase
MPIAIGTADPALQPAAAATRASEVGAAATRKALDQQELEGRAAVQLVAESAAQTQTQDPPPDTRGQNVDRRA